MREELGVPVLGRGVLSSWNVEPSDSVYFSPPKQAVASSEPNFWTHSLQIHCNGPSPKTETLQYQRNRVLYMNVIPSYINKITTLFTFSLLSF